jgi:hypothetical protein
LEIIVKNTIVIAAAMAVLAAGAAAAQQAPAANQAARGLRADTDGDRRISQAEFVSRRLDRLTAADANRDGSVTAEERRAVASTRKASRAADRFQRLDVNGDGAISREEFDARRAGHADRAQTRPARAMRVARRAQRLERGAEIEIAQAQARAEQAFVRLDADRDGYITVAERQARTGAMREQRRERMAERRALRMQSAPPPSSE